MHGPVKFILSAGPWQKGFDLAMRQHDDGKPLVNPFDMDDEAFYGFEDGRAESEKFKGVKQ